MGDSGDDSNDFTSRSDDEEGGGGEGGIADTSAGTGKDCKGRIKEGVVKEGGGGGGGWMVEANCEGLGTEGKTTEEGGWEYNAAAVECPQTSGGDGNTTAAPSLLL